MMCRCFIIIRRLAVDVNGEFNPSSESETTIAGQKGFWFAERYIIYNGRPWPVIFIFGEEKCIMWVVCRSPPLSLLSFRIHLAPRALCYKLIELSRRRGRYFRTSATPRDARKEAFMRTALKIHEEPVRVNMAQVEIFWKCLRFCCAKFSL
jgi:hypothetical protein